jgi:hypothetical protein
VSLLRGVEPLPRGPATVQYEVGTAKSPEATYVILEIRTPSGETSLFLPPDFAREMGKAILDEGLKAKHSGIIVPRPTFPPNGKPPR